MFLVENTEARNHHEAALTAALAEEPDYVDVHRRFGLAETVVIKERSTYVEPTIDNTVQLARIKRDTAFTWLRAASEVLEFGNHQRELMLEQANNGLFQAAELTEDVIGHAMPYRLYKETGKAEPSGSRRDKRHEVFAEHGATLALLARFVTAKTTYREVDSRGDASVAQLLRRDDQEYYGAAHDFCRSVTTVITGLAML